jgi:hypothetical protein
MLGASSLRSVAVVWLLTVLWTSDGAAAASCTYRTYSWNTYERRPVDFREVRHPYSELRPVEIHEPTGCTVCEEDQIEITLPGVAPFRLCKFMAYEIRQALLRAMAEGERINSVVGYRVGMTKGDIDGRGNRTRFSNHSFGIAIDVNQLQNGLYDNCVSFGPGCRLIRGGAWEPEQEGSLTPHSRVVRDLGEIGLKWGGQIEGRQKDFMHFSPSGY